MLMYVYSLFCVLLPCAVYQFIQHAKTPLQAHKIHHFAWVYILLVYLYLVYSITGFGTLWDIGSHEYLISVNKIILIPFQSEGLMTYVSNILLFVPLGFLLPLIWWEMRNLKHVCITGAALSLSIEISQLLNNRYSDIDDLLMNIVGAMIGYGLWMVSYKIFEKTNEKAVSMNEKEAKLHLILSALGYFFLYDWKLFL